MPDLPTAPRLLTRLAHAAAAQPPAPGRGRYDYVNTRGWYLNTDRDTTGTKLRARIEPTVREQWLSGDGSGRIEEMRAGRRTDTSGTYGAGELSAPQDLPTDPAALRRTLTGDQPADRTVDAFRAVDRVWNTQVVTGQRQSALLRMLADMPGIVDRCEVTDRACRRGVALSVDATRNGATTRRTLIVSPATGMLLDYEVTALSADTLPVDAPATIAYTVWLATGHTTSTETSPQ